MPTAPVRSSPTTITERTLIPVSSLALVVVVVLWLGRTSYVAETADKRVDRVEARVDDLESRQNKELKEQAKSLGEIKATVSATDARVEIVLRLLEESRQRETKAGR